MGTPQVIEWLEFTIDSENEPDMEVTWRIHVPFVLSRFECIFGRGCPGHFGVQSGHTFPDIGCCTMGAWFEDEADIQRTQKVVDLLTADDWDQNLDAKYRKDWLVRYTREPKDDGEVSAKTRVHQGGCVFANRSDGSAGKPGCAFVAYATRVKAQGEELSHADVMPNVCSHLPLRVKSDSDDVNYLVPWTKDEWGGKDDDDKYDSWMHWWCVDDSPEVFQGAQPVYLSYERELRRAMGNRAYEYMVERLKERLALGPVRQMPAVTDGKPLPTFIGARIPVRKP